MSDIIQLLPDAIANQIAAGEVIQRPSSVVKELVENAVDAGATKIKLVVKDAGKTLIQVIDNGCGMSDTDARMCFERHATSKLRKAKDLFSIRTMGFRGEAMASIAAIAHVEARTRKGDSEVGTRIVMEGSEVKLQESCQCAEGTVFAVKNLFYNVPARRNFLKSDAVEMRHIIEEFQRIALAHPDIFFSLHHNGAEMFHLPAGNLRQRVVGALGQHANKKLVPIEEETDIVRIRGFVGKAEFAKKSRGDQYFFVNDRFIKSSYLNHAVTKAYDELLPQGHYPLYVIFIDIDPARIDINVHPTKQEIKFDDEKLLYHYIQVTIRHAMAQHNVTPTLDFEADLNFGMIKQPNYAKTTTTTQSFSSGANPSNDVQKVVVSSSINPKHRHENNLKHWQSVYEGLEENTGEPEKIESKLNAPLPKQEELSVAVPSSEPITIESKMSRTPVKKEKKGAFSKEEIKPYQIHNTYVVSQIRSGFMLIDQQAAHERILYERYLNVLSEQEPVTQKQLFTKTIKVPTADVEVLKEILPAINQLGFDIQEFGSDSFVIHGVPTHVMNVNEQELIEELIQQYKESKALDMGVQEKIARSMALSASIKRGTSLNTVEMRVIIDELFACAMPYKCPRGKNCFTTFDLEDVAKRFES